MMAERPGLTAAGKEKKCYRDGKCPSKSVRQEQPRRRSRSGSGLQERKGALFILQIPRRGREIQGAVEELHGHLIARVDGRDFLG